MKQDGKETPTGHFANFNWTFHDDIKNIMLRTQRKLFPEPICIGGTIALKYRVFHFIVPI